MKILYSKLCPYFYNGKKCERIFVYFLSFFDFPAQQKLKVLSYLYLRVSGSLAHSGNFSSFNSAILSFSVSSTSLDLCKLYNCIVSFQL